MATKKKAKKKAPAKKKVAAKKPTPRTQAPPIDAEYEEVSSRESRNSDSDEE